MDGGGGGGEMEVLRDACYTYDRKKETFGFQQAKKKRNG